MEGDEKEDGDDDDDNADAEVELRKFGMNAFVVVVVVADAPAADAEDTPSTPIVYDGGDDEVVEEDVDGDAVDDDDVRFRLFMRSILFSVMFIFGAREIRFDTPTPAAAVEDDDDDVD